MELASGLNRFVIHTSVHQPLDDKKPGFSLGPFGQYFTRQETWAEYAKPWIDYLGRSSYMLQQGRNVADILYYYGENNNITWICREKLPEIPTGFEFDFVNSTALLNAISVENEKLVAQSGNTYDVLVLDESAKYMTLPVLKKIQELTQSGVKIVGERPEKSPSLTDDDASFQKIAEDIWQSDHIVSFETLGLKPDVIITNADNEIRFRHRKTPNEDIYWFNNRSEIPANAEISFRITSKVPELWNPQTGKIEPMSYQIVDGRTIVPLKFESWDAFFIVFNDNATSDHFTKQEATESTISQITGPWSVYIAKKEIKMDNLVSWTENDDSDIKYFSGTASYRNSIEIKEMDTMARYIIDLGQVNNLVEVVLNGQNLGILWKQPFKMDITEALQTGQNVLELNVTNLWVNRLIGDAQPNANKSTFTTMPFYQADSPLLASGLLGPVKLLSVTN